MKGYANERFREVDQVKFAYADMHGNVKVMLRSPVQRKYVLRIRSENDIANILSRLDCEYERFDEIYPSDDTWSLYYSISLMDGSIFDWAPNAPHI